MDYRRRLLFLVNFLCLTVAQPPFRDNVCVQTGNYSTNSPYEANLRTLLSSLSPNIGADGFYNASAGQNPDQVNAVALCRGDVELDTCRSCLNDSAHKILQICPNYKEAIGWYGYCMLRYSNRSIFGTLDTSPTSYLYSTAIVSGNVTKFNQALNPLLVALRGEAAAGGPLRKFATGNTSTPDFINIYGLSQCTPDLSEQDCENCLVNAAAVNSVSYSGTNGASVLEPNCNLEYEVYPFYKTQSAIDGQPFHKETTTAGASSPAPGTTGVSSSPAPGTGTTGVSSSPAPGTTGVSSPAPGTRTTGVSSPSPGHGITTSQMVIIFVVLTQIFVALTIYIFCTILRKQKHNKPKEKNESVKDSSFTENLQYNFSTIQAATDNFSDRNKLGQGGFGSVYKGRLPNGQKIAVKRLLRNLGQGDLQFKNEVVLVAKLQHRGLVGLLGFCLEGAERLLIYEFVPNASLDYFIFDPTKQACLDWDRRYKIIGGVARGLLYLHEDSRLRIIHRDLKASNVLLDEEMNPKIADFGLARLFVCDETQGNTSRVVGTYGYMAPEYAMRGQFSAKSDVFSFGVLVLEIISGQRNYCFRAGTKVEDLPTCVIFQAWKHWKSGMASTIIDATLTDGSGSLQDIIRCIHIALLCVEENVANRPTMASVVAMLNSFSLTLPLPSEPAFFKDNTVDYELLMDCTNAFESAKEASV